MTPKRSGLRTRSSSRLRRHRCPKWRPASGHCSAGDHAGRIRDDITIEDETGIANLVVWPNVFEMQRRVILSAGMLGIHGRIQREGDVVHLIAPSIDRSLGGAGKRWRSRRPPFHCRHGRGDEFHRGSSGGAVLSALQPHHFPRRHQGAGRRGHPPRPRGTRIAISCCEEAERRTSRLLTSMPLAGELTRSGLSPVLMIAQPCQQRQEAGEPTLGHRECRWPISRRGDGRIIGVMLGKQSPGRIPGSGLGTPAALRPKHYRWLPRLGEDRDCARPLGSFSGTPTETGGLRLLSFTSTGHWCRLPFVRYDARFAGVTSGSN